MIDYTKSTTPESEKDCAQTPIWFVDSLLDLIGLNSFDLDVCCLPQTAKAEDYYSLEDGENSLELPWKQFNFCNPPFTNIMPFIEKAVDQAGKGSTTAILLPNNPETAYIRKIKEVSCTVIEMPFRLKFLRPDGTKFLDKKGKEQGPQFSCLVGLITPLGLKASTRYMYHDFRVGFYDSKK